MSIDWKKWDKLEQLQNQAICEMLDAKLVESTTGNNSDYDSKFIKDDKNFTVEIKIEQGADQSGNIVVEVYNTKQRKPSGINATKATHWCNTYYDHDRKQWATFFAKTKQLKAWLEAEVENETVYNATNWRSDNNAALVLVPWHRLKNFINNPIYCITWDCSDPKTWL